MIPEQRDFIMDDEMAGMGPGSEDPSWLGYLRPRGVSATRATLPACGAPTFGAYKERL